MKKRPDLSSGQFRTNYLPKLLFSLSVVISIIATYHVSAHFIDSDTSSELVLSQQLIEMGRLLSPDWFYATELRFLHVQWIYIPLMLLLDDWLMVRYIGALVMQALYIISFACLVRAAGKGKNFFYYGASLLLLPVSVTYGRVILYHNHYLLNLTLSFFVLALSMYFADAVNWRSRKTWIRLFCLAVISFAGGLNSIRQLMITHVPFAMIPVLLYWVEDLKSKDPGKTSFFKPANFNFLICAAYCGFFSFAGLLAQRILVSKLGIHVAIQAENVVMNFSGFQNIGDILYAFFHQFGYRTKASMLSVSGLLSLGGIFIGCYLMFLAAKQLLQSNPNRSRRTTLLSVSFLTHVAVMLLIFMMTSGEGGYNKTYYYPLYLSLCYPWAIPLLLIHFEELPARMHPMYIKKFFAVVTVVILLLSSSVNLAYFQGSNRFPQTYEGLTFQDKDKKAELTEAVKFLTEQGYDKGYAGYWECNIVTEMTNGNIPMVLIKDYHEDKGANLAYRDWLTPLWNRESPCQKPFLLLRNELWNDVFPETDSSAYCTLIYSDDHCTAYRIDDLEAFADTLRY